MDPPHLRNLDMCRARAALSTEAYLQGLSVGLATLGGSDGWMRFILPVENEAPNGKVASPERTWRVAMIRYFLLKILCFDVLLGYHYIHYHYLVAHPTNRKWVSSPQFFEWINRSLSHVNHWVVH